MKRCTYIQIPDFLEKSGIFWILWTAIYSASRLGAVQSDLSPNLSPTRREALILAPLP
jgi:hypothetical protein